jgi:hypothetical protein
VGAEKGKKQETCVSAWPAMYFKRMVINITVETSKLLALLVFAASKKLQGRQPGVHEQAVQRFWQLPAALCVADTLLKKSDPADILRHIHGCALQCAIKQCCSSLQWGCLLVARLGNLQDVPTHVQQTELALM